LKETYKTWNTVAATEKNKAFTGFQENDERFYYIGIAAYFLQEGPLHFLNPYTVR
jgi:hypothetical protein